MNEQKKWVPKLRFPAFRGAGGWESTRLEELCEVITKGSTPTSYGFDYVESGVRFVKIESLSGGLVDCSKTAFITEDCNVSFFRSQLKENDILFSIAGALGVIALVDRKILPANTNQAIGIIRLKQGYSHQFLQHQLQADLIQSEIQRIKAGAAQPNISLSQLGDFVALLPAAAEQQKIAECLSSVDALMAAQARKVDALKTHKKGLMQQLFPREGETQPRLRFPEFQNAGVWEGKKLEDLAKRGSGHTPNKAKQEYYNGGIKWVSLADSKRLDSGLISETTILISEQGIKNSSTVLHPAGSVILSRDAGVGKSAVMSESMAVSQHFIVWICDDRRLSNWFLYYILQIKKPVFESVASGSTIKTIGLPFFKELCITVPSVPEQQRIATCLSSLDTLITLETQKLEALKTHKKGLMQQLFPSPEEVEA